MAEYIDRKSAIDVVTKWFDKIHQNGDICIDGLISLPTANVVERKTGKWIPIKGETGVEAFGFKENTVIAFFCSNCEEDVDVSEGDFNFCPNCGAQMIGGDDDV